MNERCIYHGNAEIILFAPITFMQDAAGRLFQELVEASGGEGTLESSSTESSQVTNQRWRCFFQVLEPGLLFLKDEFWLRFAFGCLIDSRFHFDFCAR